MEALKEKYQRVLASIPAGVTLLAVSKSQPVDAIEELYRLGHRDFGENYVQELVEKAQQLRARGCFEIRWHFIGHLQTNKVKQLLPHVFCIHSVDSVKLAREIDKRASSRLPVFVQVNQDEEASKSGFKPSDVEAAVMEIKGLKNLELLGLMTIPEPGGEVREKFSALRDFAAKCGLKKLSMGMSGDYELAIAEGATHVRVGTSIFGLRKT